MTTIAKIISLLALMTTIIPSVLLFVGAVDHEAVKWIALGGTIAWFIATPLWMGRELPLDADQVEI